MQDTLRGFDPIRFLQQEVRIGEYYPGYTLSVQDYFKMIDLRREAHAATDEFQSIF